jgi:hypothetical protein
MNSSKSSENDFLNIGFGNAIVTSRIIALITPNTASGKRMREEAKEMNRLVDVSLGRKIRSIIIMDSGHVILSALNTDTIIGRLGHDSTKE